MALRDEDAADVDDDTAEVQDWAGRALREMAEESFFYGTPANAAAQIRPFVDAGVDFVGILDMTAFVLPPEEIPFRWPAASKSAAC